MTHKSEPMPGGEFLSANQPMTAVTDPVCGMMVNPATSKGHLEYKGQKYFFCSSHCLSRFTETPERYLDRPEEERPRSPIERRPGDPLPRVPFHDQMETASTIRDPACGIMTNPADSDTVQGPHGETYYVCHPGAVPHKGAPEAAHPAGAPETPGASKSGAVEHDSPTLQDPVCGMIADPARGAPSYTYKGHKYYFCSPACLQAFRDNPEKYLQRTGPRVSRRARAAMAHPESADGGPHTRCPGLFSTLAQWIRR
jgi:Cu+-exporting ATPase